MHELPHSTMLYQRRVMRTAVNEPHPGGTAETAAYPTVSGSLAPRQNLDKSSSIDSDDTIAHRFRPPHNTHTNGLTSLVPLTLGHLQCSQSHNR